MKFLERIASIIIENYESPRKLVVVFPNRRAGLFLKNILQTRATSPVWSPDIVSFQDLISRESSLTPGDPVQLVHTLYQVYRKHLPMAGEEGFERFYYWGKMLLQDFDEIDKYLVNGEALYRNLMHYKELDLTFDFLSDEQKEILQTFWKGFEKSRSENKDKFLATWEKLGLIYTEFRQRLKEEGVAYEGMLYRELAENIDNHEWKYPREHVLFAGFNALTRAEEKIIEWCLMNGDTRVEWDLDAYYMNNRQQEAGRFFREYKSNPVFRRTFPDPVPDRLGIAEKELSILGVPQHVGQARIAGQRVGQLIAADPSIARHRIAIVLADESLLLPMLHALPENCGPVNVTMGFPLSFAPVNSLIEHLSELQIFYRPERGYYSRAVLDILRHPLIMPYVDQEAGWLRDLEKKNLVYVKKEHLNTGTLSELLFRNARNDFLTYIIEILRFLENEPGLDEMNRTFIHHYRQHFTRYQDIIRSDDGKEVHVDTFRRLFRQLANTEKVPFTGEPLQGIQVMGVLETRNLDFDHVFMLSCNEGNIPSGARQHSFIPYNIRKAYELPHYDQQDAMYAYLFYRLLQGVKSAFFTWGTEGNEFGEEEMSRFLKQLLFEFPLKPSNHILANDMDIEQPVPITIHRNAAVGDKLSAYLDGSRKRGISPSALNAYMECRLRFYFRYVAGLYEPDEIEEDLDARTFGEVLHQVMEDLYEDHRKQYGPEVTGEDIKRMRKNVDKYLEGAFRRFYDAGTEDQFALEGKNLIAGAIIRDFVLNILNLDEEYAPFEIIGLEEKFNVWEDLGDGKKVKMFGVVDRVDRKDGHLRVIDYKTGKDEQKFTSVEGLFQDNPNKVAFQTFLYTMLYQRETGVETNMAPYVFNRSVVFSGGEPRFIVGKRNQGVVIKQIQPYMEEFKDHLHDLLHEVFYSDTPFTQTEDEKKCLYCEFNVICRRA